MRNSKPDLWVRICKEFAKKMSEDLSQRLRTLFLIEGLERVKGNRRKIVKELSLEMLLY